MSGKKEENKRIPYGKADRALEEVERACAMLAAARRAGDRKSQRETEKALEAAGAEVARIAGAKGWEWLGWGFSGEGDTGQTSSERTRGGYGRHPGLGAARSGDSEELRILMERGCPISPRLPGFRTPDLAHLAATDRSAGAWGVLREKALEGLEGGEEERKEAVQQLMGWVSGCADAMWAEGIRECEEDFARAFAEERPTPYWGSVFGSPMTQLIYSDAAKMDTRRAEETLREMLRICPAERWPMERDGEEFREIYYEGEETTFFREAMIAGAWWALESLFVEERDSEPGRLEGLMEEIQEGEVATEDPEAIERTLEKCRELLARIEARGLGRAAAEPAKRKAGKKSM